ncbi:MAG: hypothetical protein ACLU8S_22020 [Coprococcus phoceensis]
MMIAKNDEEKRSKMWRFVTGIASIIIILVVAFFITKLFCGQSIRREMGIRREQHDADFSGK